MQLDQAAADATDPGAAVLFCLHFLGGSGREWAGVAERLGPAARCVAVDLPGFGDATASDGHGAPGAADHDVAAMAEHVARAVRAVAPRRWLLVGHSMGAKVAMALARRAEDGEAGLEGLAGLALLAGSPPTPEPMAEKRRREMLGWFAGTPEQSREQARRYVGNNTGAPLPAEAAALAEADVLRADRAAWVAWLEHGSREDWSARIGRLRSPALILAGSEDADLGAEAQRRLSAPHFARARIEVLDGAGHLLPLERPDAVAALLREHVAACLPGAGAAPVLGAAFRALIESDRVSTRLRAALLERARPDDPDRPPLALDAARMAVLRAALDRVLPQPAEARIDLAARIDALMLLQPDDGWRYASLPPDAEAYRAGLDTLDAAARHQHGLGFARLDGEARDALLRRAADGTLADGPLDGAAMKLWFEDLRSDATRIYVSHPATMERMGYGGFAMGGDGPRKSGFARVGLGEREDWEPLTPAAAEEATS